MPIPITNYLLTIPTLMMRSFSHLGSYYETHCTKDYDFEFQKDSTFTDDTVLTVAVCKAILNNPDTITRWNLQKRGLEYAGQFRQYYSYYPHAGFGNMFSEWARSDTYK